MTTKLYIARHGKTMFNTIGRAQGWSDTPLTAEGERGIKELALGLKESGLQFDQAVSSDSGRTIQTMGILLDGLGLRDQIPYHFDKRIREWCFGSFDGAYDGELFLGLLPRIFNVERVEQLSFPELAEGIVELDTAGWAQSWPVLSERILEGFTAIAEDLEAKGGGNALVVSHGMTIGTLCYLLEGLSPQEVENGSITEIEYQDGNFKIKKVGDLSYRQVGAKLLN